MKENFKLKMENRILKNDNNVKYSYVGCVVLV